MGKDRNTNIRGSYRMPAVTFGGGLMLAAGAEYFGGDHWLVFVAFFSGILIVIFGVLWGVAEWISDRKYLRNSIEGNGAPDVSVELVSNPPYINDLLPVCAVRFTNDGPSLEGKCLVKIERHGISGIPDPLPVRTEGQIRGKRTGRFTLSHGEPKYIPVVFRVPATVGRHMFIGEDGEQYVFTGSSVFNVAIYGADTPTKAQIRFDVGDNGKRSVTMEYC